MSDFLRCQAGCKVYTGNETYHHKDCYFYPESFSKRFDDLQAQLATHREAEAELAGALEDMIRKLNDRCTTEDDLSDESPCNKAIIIANEALEKYKSK